jgi:predicted ATPase with chaperone activity
MVAGAGGVINRCPCGERVHPEKICSSLFPDVEENLGRISGSLLDCRDIYIEMPLEHCPDLWL